MNDELGYLEKVDLVRRRTGLSFAEARNLLEEADWDLLEALTNHEASKNAWGNQMLDRVKEIFDQGNKTKIVVKAKEDTVVELPVTVGILGAVLAPKVALLGAATCLLTRCSLQLHKQSNFDAGDFSVPTDADND
jgi:hypothetical protein